MTGVTYARSLADYILVYGAGIGSARALSDTKAAMTDIDFPTDVPFTGEPALEDMIADPIVQAVMRVDGLVEADLRRAVMQARQALAGDSRT